MRVYLLRRVLPLPKKYTLFEGQISNSDLVSFAVERLLAEAEGDVKALAGRITAQKSL
jgi:hypothetical protein